MANIQATIITIGDELLIGQTIDTNSAWMAKQLNEIGIDVRRRVAVGDDAEEIKNALDEEIPGASVILLTGGLGPTADDITKPLLCDYFGGKLIVDEKVLEHVNAIFAKRKRPILERNLKQAEVPDNCKIMWNRLGTAPGMLFEKDGAIIISMPGVPFEMVAVMEDSVLPMLRQRYISDAIVHRTIFTAGEGESFIAERIKDLEDVLPPYIKLAYLPSPGIVKLRLTGKGEDERRLIKEVEQRQEEIASRLENIVVSLHDLPLENILGQVLLQKKARLGLAESCTGGNIAHLITQVMGSGNYFNGGVVCYQNHVKETLLGVSSNTLEEYGAVSEQTAIEMAEGARKALKSDYGFGITGLLSGGGDDERVPVGTVWMAIADKDRTLTKDLHLSFDRIRNKDVAVQMAMLMIWKFLNGKL